MRKKIAFVLCIVLFLTGCSVQPAVSENVQNTEEPVLLEPLEAVEYWEQAKLRSLYDAAVYNAGVYPYTEEYSFGIDVSLASLAVYPGDKVRRGAVLAQGDTETLDQSIEDLEERIRTMEEEYEEYRSETEESLYDSEMDAEWLKEIMENYEAEEPPMYDVSGGDVSGGNAQDGETVPEEPKLSEAYLKWQKDHTTAEGNYRILDHRNNTARLELEQRTEIYEIDHAYLLAQLEKLKSEKIRHTLTSSMKGEVAAVTPKQTGSRISQGESVIAIADPDRKLIKSDNISNAALINAEEIYAVINGVRYEVENLPYTSAETEKMRSSGETIYSVFELQDAEDVSLGDYAVIVLVRRARRDVVTLPTSAIHGIGKNMFVYMKQGEETVSVPVITGMSDGTYTEILSGVQEGDLVQISVLPQTESGETMVLEKSGFHTNFMGNGILYYPETYDVKNTVSYGTMYMVEYQVSLHERVKAGTVIATVRVVGDDMEMQRSYKKLERLQERLDDLIKEDAEGNEKTIEQRREEIADLQELINEKTSDYAVTQILAPNSGIVNELSDYKEGDVLSKGAVLARIADVDTCCLLLENRGQLLRYGNEVTITYQTPDGEDKEVQGQVTSLSNPGSSRALQSNNVMVKIPSELVGEMMQYAYETSNPGRQGQFRVEAPVMQMENVLLVPRTAVKIYQNQTYVTVLENGEWVERSFIPGGSDNGSYWVADGLAEGMTICLK